MIVVIEAFAFVLWVLEEEDLDINDGGGQSTENYARISYDVDFVGVG